MVVRPPRGEGWIAGRAGWQPAERDREKAVGPAAGRVSASADGRRDAGVDDGLSARMPCPVDPSCRGADATAWTSPWMGGRRDGAVPVADAERSPKG